jgi:glucose/arabinose dehydrogenase
MRLRLAALVSTAAIAAGLSVVAVAQPPAETRDPNKAGHKPAFSGQTRAPALTTDTQYEVKEVVASGLASPWSVEFLPGGKFLITERLAGQFRIAGADGKLSPPIKDGVPAVVALGQGGLLDAALDPNFATNKTIYWSYAEPKSDGTNNTAVAKGVLVDGAQPKLEKVQVIWRQTPALQSNLHFGSRLVFAKDGTLFVTLGERSVRPGRMQSQDLQSGLGKIVRINTDGSIPKDNPFNSQKSNALPEIWSYGHRNVQGAFLHPVTGELWELEHGPQGGDEINIARKGKDYGWPTITYGVEYGGAHTKIGDGAAKAGMEQPLYYWDPVIAPGGLAYYNADLFPKWKGSVFAAGLNPSFVARLTVDGEKVTGEERFKFSDRNERYRDINVGPDGAIYLLTDGPNARLLKVVPKA